MSARQLWLRIVATDQYVDWWPWLREFDDDRGFVNGTHWRCTVSPPLPYVMRFSIHIDEVVAGRTVSAHVDGDIGGTARLSIEPLTRRTCEARLVSELAPSDPALRLVGAMARPLVRWGHDWILDRGREQFIRSVP